MKIYSKGLSIFLMFMSVGFFMPAFAASSLLIESLRKPQISVPQEIITAYKDWQINCPNPALKQSQEKSCTMRPSAESNLNSENGIQIYGRNILVKGKSLPVFVIQTGLDLLLPEGVTLAVDKRKPVKLAFRSCHLDGCIIPFQMSGKIKLAMQKGNDLTISVKGLNFKTRKLLVSLNGFSAALRHLRKP